MLDSLGVNLTSEGDTWKYVQDLAVWEDAPGWDGVTIIDGFEIVDETYDKNGTAKVTVKYHVIGDRSGEVAKKVNKDLKVTYEVLNLGGVWKIKEPQLEPHILPHIEKRFSSPVSSTE